MSPFGISTRQRPCALDALPVRRGTALLLSALLALFPAAYGQEPAQTPSTPMVPLPTVQSLRVVPLTGQAAMNDLERRVMAPLVVQVLDQNARPVDGADVAFRFPLNGPSATFSDGRNSRAMKTNADGQAAATGWLANDQLGSFDVRVTATRGNEAGEAVISMTNVTRIVDEGRPPRKKWWSSKWFKIAVIAGGAGTVAAIILATRTPTITVSPGTPTIGGPQ
jgi:hypothetical protein